MATRGWLTRLMTARGQLLNVGRAVRLATPAIRKAVVWRDRRCVVRGCTAQAQYCHVDHTREYRFGGETSYDNSALLCARHNYWKARHLDRFQFLRHADGRVEYVIHQPSGWRPIRT